MVEAFPAVEAIPAVSPAFSDDWPVKQNSLISARLTVSSETVWSALVATLALASQYIHARIPVHLLASFVPSDAALQTLDCWELLLGNL
jgi:hypothetical protein